MKAIGLLTVGFVVAVLLAIWSGYVLAILWAWFIAPVFGIAELTVPSAAGIVIIVRMLTYQISSKDEDDDIEALFKAVFVSALHPLMALGVGWVVHPWV